MWTFVVGAEGEAGFQKWESLRTAELWFHRCCESIQKYLWYDRNGGGVMRLYYAQLLQLFFSAPHLYFLMKQSLGIHCFTVFQKVKYRIKSQVYHKEISEK